jgi:hypothetical protein
MVMNYGFITDRPLLLTHLVFSFVQRASKQASFEFPAMISSFFLIAFFFDFLIACLSSSWATEGKDGGIGPYSFALLKQASSKQEATRAQRSSQQAKHFGTYVNWIHYLLLRERGGPTFSHPSTWGISFPHHQAPHITPHKQPNDITTSRSQRYLSASTFTTQTDTNDSHERMSMMNGTI